MTSNGRTPFKAFTDRAVRATARLSLGLCAFSAILWLASAGPFARQRFGSAAVFLYDGKFCIGDWVTNGDSAKTMEGWGLGVITHFRFVGTSGSRWSMTHIELWFVPLVCALLPAVYYRIDRPITHLARRRRALAGLCPECGYDLRAASDRCPECGTPLTAVAEALK